ncbi:MAG: sensor histidine kinase [Egibacteraceae bacterium]
MQRSNGVDIETGRRGQLRSGTAAFCVAGLMAFTVVGAGTWLWGQRTGTIRVIADVRAETQRLSARIQQAGVVTALRSDDPAAIEVVDQLVGGQGAEVLRVALRTADGETVYARDKAALSAKAPLDPTALQSLRSRVSASELKLTSDPRDITLRIHQPVQAVGGDALLLQVDYDYGSIIAGGRQAWQTFAPGTLGALAAMAGLWLCLAGLAGRRGRRREATTPTIRVNEPDRWLEPEPEVPEVATPVLRITGGWTAGKPVLTPAAHARPAPPLMQDDGWLGMVQGGTPWPAVPFTEPVCEDDVVLPGALRDGGSRTWSGPPAAEAVAPGVEEHAHASAAHASANGNGNRRRNGSNGSNGASPTPKTGILVNSRRRGLEAALSSMLLPLARRGIDTRLDLPPGLELPETTEGLLIRAAEEAVRNSVSHAQTNTVKVRLDVRDQRVEMTIDDDGHSFDPAEFDGSPGRLGLRTLTRLAADAGGALHVRSSPNRGTRLHLDLPAS